MNRPIILQQLFLAWQQQRQEFAALEFKHYFHIPVFGSGFKAKINPEMGVPTSWVKATLLASLQQIIFAFNTYSFNSSCFTGQDKNTQEQEQKCKIYIVAEFYEHLGLPVTREIRQQSSRQWGSNAIDWNSWKKADAEGTGGFIMASIYLPNHIFQYYSKNLLCHPSPFVICRGIFTLIWS